MKKNLCLSLLFFLISLQPLKADCRYRYTQHLEKKKIHLWGETNKNKVQEFYRTLTLSSSVTFLPIAVLTLVGPYALAPVLIGTFIVVPVAIASSALIYNPIKVAPYKKVIRLINQSYAYQESGYRHPPKLLRKTHKGLKDKIPSLESFADSIIEANENGTLCSGLDKYRQLLKDISKSKITLVHLTDGPDT